MVKSLLCWTFFLVIVSESSHASRSLRLSAKLHTYEKEIKSLKLGSNLLLVGGEGNVKQDETVLHLCQKFIDDTDAASGLLFTTKEDLARLLQACLAGNDPQSDLWDLLGERGEELIAWTLMNQEQVMRWRPHAQASLVCDDDDDGLVAHGNLPAPSTRDGACSRFVWLEDKSRRIIECSIPSLPRKNASDVNLVPVEKFGKWKDVFPSHIRALNRMQSAVFPVAFETSKNLLVLAPTGAGKTNVAVSVILRELDREEKMRGDGGRVLVVYIAPLKALAAEVTRTLTRMLSRVNASVVEVTGDMVTSPADVSRASVMVCTPEKLDVMTRKPPSSLVLMQRISLMIVDEVQILNEDRGPVVEALVARFLRHAEIAGSYLRLVGLSATLPNFKDVARFLHVEEDAGLFTFGPETRPVPLAQHFVGVGVGAAGGADAADALPPPSEADAAAVEAGGGGGGGGALAAAAVAGGAGAGTRAGARGAGRAMGGIKEALLEACWDRVIRHIRMGQHVLVFVHTRKDTVKTAEFLLLRAQEERCVKMIAPTEENGRLGAWKKHQRYLGNLRDRRLPSMTMNGIAVHHAGMTRQDRTVVERAFEDGALALLVSTSTLAWGVNLPARVVIIKGVEYFDPNAGREEEITALELQQMFGRAGRPQFDAEGDAYVLCSRKKLQLILSRMTAQVPIESRMEDVMELHINAEIAAGSISNLEEVLDWISKTFFCARLRSSQDASRARSASKEEAEGVVNSMLLRHANKTLEKLLSSGLIVSVADPPSFLPTKYAQVVSQHYLSLTSARDILARVSPNSTMYDILMLAAGSDEMASINVRAEEEEELRQVMDNLCYIEIGRGEKEEEQEGELTASHKVAVMIQMFTLRREFSTPSISSDAQYVFQNCIRVFRAISDLSLLKDCAKTAEIASSWAIAVELQVPILYHPLYGYELNRNQQAEGRSKHVRMQRAAMVPSGLTEALAALQRQGVDTAALAACSSLLPLRRIVGNQLPERDLMYVVQLAQSFPRVEIAAEAQSYGERLFKIVFNASLSSRSPQETFLVHLQDSQGTVIFSDRLSFSKLHNSTTVRCVIARDRVFPLLITALSDRWLQCKTQLVLRSATSLFNNDKPGGVRSRCSTIAAVPPLPTSVLSARERKFLFPSSTSESMNSIMTSTFFQLRHTFEDFLMAGEEWLRETLERVAMFAVFQELESWEREAARIDRGNGACGRSKVVIVCKDRAEAWKWYRQWGLKFQQQFETEVSCCDVTSSANLHVLGAEGLLTLDGPLLLSQARVVIVHGLQPGATCAELELAAAAVKKQQSTEVEKKRTRMITLVSSVINNVNDIQRWLHVPPPSCFLPFRHGIPIGVTLKILSFPRGSSPDRTILNLVGRTAGRPSLVVCRTFGEARRLSMLVARKVAEQEADEDLFRVAAVFQDQSLSALASHGVGLLGKRMLRTGAGAGSGAGAGGAGAGDGRVVMSDDELLIVELHRANKVRLLLVDVEYLLSSLPSNLLQLEHAIVALPPLCRIDKHGAAGRGRFASFVADSPSSIYSSLCQTLGKFKWTSGNARTASLVVHEGDEDAWEEMLKTPPPFVSPLFDRLHSSQEQEQEQEQEQGLRRATEDLYPFTLLRVQAEADSSPRA